MLRTHSAFCVVFLGATLVDLFVFVWPSHMLCVCGVILENLIDLFQSFLMRI